jgi:hypothetical protein
MSTTGMTFAMRDSADPFFPEMSDTAEGIYQFPTNHGLLIAQEQDEGYQTQVSDRKIRSQSRMVPQLYSVVIINCYSNDG